MAYKGDDLNLQLPGAGGPVHQDGEPPVAVDETVLACCNSAFDAAVFQGSGEVRPGHLLYALTRVPAAAALLAEIGIDAAQLRRETAAAIAAEIPAGPIDEQHAPRATASFAQIVETAAELATRRRAPTSVEDLVRSLLDGGAASPTAALLMRAAADPQALEGWRDAPLRADAQAVPAAGTAQVASVVNHALMQRLDTFEAAFAALRAEVAADRKALADLLRSVQGEFNNLRSATEHPIAADQLRGLDAVLGAKHEALDSRLEALGGAVAALSEQLAGENPEQVRARAEAFEGRIAAQARGAADALSGALTDRLDQADASLQGLREEIERHGSSVNERQIALEASVRAQLQGAEDARKGIERGLAEIYEALVKLGTNQQTLGENLSTWRLENSGDIGIISNRLQQLEQTAMGMLSHLNGELQTLRQETIEDGGPLDNGFKRWLYGTRNVFAGREEPARQSIAPPRKGEAS